MADAVNANRDAALRRRLPANDASPKQDDAAFTPLERPKTEPGDKSIVVAYTYWMLGGMFGLHHIYLERPTQAFLWSTTGGLGLMGYLRDAWRIPAYVAQANQDDGYYLQHFDLANAPAKGKPGIFSWMTLLLLVMPTYYRWVVVNTIPRLNDERVENYDAIQAVVGALTVAVSTYLIGHIQYRKSGSFAYALFGAAAGEALTLYLTYDDPAEDWDPKTGFYPGWLATFAAFICFSWSKTYTRAPRKGKKTSCGKSCKNYTTMFFAVFAFWACLGVGSYNNLVMENDDGEMYRFKESIDEIYNSPVWAQLGSQLNVLYQTAQKDGFEEFWKEFMSKLDMDGKWAEENAYETLGVDQDADQATIKKAVRKLQKKYHPDICKEDKDVCVDKFQKVQEANNLLNERSKSKAQANAKQDMSGTRRKKKSRRTRKQRG